jgi:hypothetical protein
VRLDPKNPLDAYAADVDTPKSAWSLQVGLPRRDLLESLGEVGEAWDSRGVGWAATGIAAGADLRRLGVRGEEAAEHLREVVRD